MVSDPSETRHRVLLVVEDDQGIRELLRHAFQDEPGVQVLIAADGAEALSAIEHVVPNAVLIDMHLPGIDGAEVARRLRSELATRNVALVGCSAAANREAALEAGCDDFVEKPFDLDHLVGTLRELLSSR